MITRLAELHSDNPAVIARRNRKAIKTRTQSRIENIKLIGNAQIDDSQRAAFFDFCEHGTGSANADRVIIRAIEAADDNSKADEMDLGWLGMLVDYVKNVFDPDMQDVWSKILDIESREPGSVPKRSLITLYGMSKSELDAFRMICRARAGEGLLLIFDIDDEYYLKNGLTEELYLSLISANLLQIDRQKCMPQDDPECFFHIGEHLISVSLKHIDECVPRDFLFGKRYAMPVGIVSFTESGKELSKAVSVEAFDGLEKKIQSDLLNNERVGSVLVDEENSQLFPLFKKALEEAEKRNIEVRSLS